MTQLTTGGRHRAPGRASTPLDVIGASVTSTLTPTAGRRAAVAVISSGLVLGTAVAAQATPDTIEEPNGTKATNLSLAEVERGATQASVVVDAAAAVGFTAASVTAEAPPPPPPVVRTTTTSRTTTREATTTEATTTEASADATTEVAAAPEISGDLAAAVVEIAMQYIGTPYVSGGASPSGFDCSGFTQYVYAQVGVSLPRTSAAQRNAGTVVSADEARAGDLIWGPGHVGIYLGDGQHVAARSPGVPLKAGPIYLSNPVFIRVL